MDIREKIGFHLKEIRNQKNLTQEAVAWKSEIDRTFMNHIENGRRNLSVKSLEKILEGLEISWREFFNSDIFGEINKKSL